MKSSKSLLPMVAFTALAALPSAAFAGRVTIESVKASSEYPAEGTTSYEARRIADGKVSTAWVEGADRNGLGESIELVFSRDSDITKVKFWAGMWYSVKDWEYASRPTEVLVKFSDGTDELVSIPDAMKVHTHTFKKPVKAKSATLILKNAKNGSTFSDTGISEVMFYDTAPAHQIEPTSVVASSTAPNDGDGNYDPMNVADGQSDTMWCEGQVGKDGTGETLTYTFGTKQTVKSLHMNNGIGTGLKFFMKGHRAAVVTLQFDDGSKQTVTLKNSMLHKSYDLTPVSTKTVKLTIDSVKKGTAFDELCLSEAYFEN